LYWIKGRAPELSSLRERDRLQLTKIGIFPGLSPALDNSYIQKWNCAGLRMEAPK
jgi:hypothetical protein